jgi:hypothetical protein
MLWYSIHVVGLGLSLWIFVDQFELVTSKRQASIEVLQYMYVYLEENLVCPNGNAASSQIHPPQQQQSNIFRHTPAAGLFALWSTTAAQRIYRLVE